METNLAQKKYANNAVGLACYSWNLKATIWACQAQAHLLQALHYDADGLSFQYTINLEKKPVAGAANVSLGPGLKKMRIDHYCTRRHAYER